MKRNVYILLVALLSLVLYSCGDENESARTPVASVMVSKTTLEIGESMEITFTGVADQVVVFTGDEEHVYQKYDGSDSIKANTGLVMSKGYFTYSYTDPGDFHVVVVASTYDTYNGDNRKEDLYEFDVTVTDDCTVLRDVYAATSVNTYYAELVNETDWLMCLPAYQLYNGRETALTANRLRLSFDIDSDASTIYLDGVEYSNRTYYNLTEIIDIRVVAYSGDTQDYRLFGMIYPEFNKITIGGVEGTLTRNEYYQDLLTYTFTGATSTTDAEYEIDSDVQLMVDGSPVSGTVDFSADREFTLVSTYPGYSHLTCTSRLVFLFE